MKIGNLRQKGNLYGRLLAAISMCVSLTLLISICIYYFYYTGIEKTRAFRSDLSNLSQTSKAIIHLNEVSQSLSFQLYRNSMIANLLYYSKPDIYDVTAAMLELRNYVNSMPFINSIYVYNSHSGLFYVVSNDGRDGIYQEDELYDQEMLGMMNDFKEIKPFVPISRVLEGQGNTGPTPVHTFVAFDAINREHTVDSAVVVNISAAWSNREAPASSSYSYILDDRGRFLSGTELEQLQLTDKEQQNIIGRITGNAENYFVEHFRGTRSLISFTSPDSLGWQYVRITPYELITEKTRSLLQMTLLIALGILLAGLVVSSLLSKRLYKPIGQMVDEMQLLENEKRDSLFTLRQNALRDLILNAKKPALQRFGISIQLESGYRLALLRIDHFQELCKSSSFSITPYKFAIMNIASEICSPAYRVEGIDMNDDSVLLLLNAQGDERLQDDGQMEALLGQCREACLEYIKIGVSGSYSPLYQDEALLHQVYTEVREASLHRFFLGYGSLINSMAITGLERDGYTYPVDVEKNLIEAVAGGKAEEALSYWTELVSSTKNYHFHASRLALSRLSVTLKSVVNNMQKRSALSLEGLPEVPDYTEYETADELQTAFTQWLEEFSERLAYKKNTKQSDLVRQINEKIEGSFADPDLNLNRIADELGMSPVYISRIYKQQTLSTIMDSVVQVRMQEVCRLLEETDLSVSSIAERTGFTSSSYLHRMFKRHLNVTPIEYRRSVKLAGSR